MGYGCIQTLQKGVDAKGAVLHLDAVGIGQEMSSWQHSGKKHKYNWAAQQQQQQQNCWCES
jgi:hypothetical protein